MYCKVVNTQRSALKPSVRAVGFIKAVLRSPVRTFIAIAVTTIIPPIQGFALYGKGFLAGLIGSGGNLKRGIVGAISAGLYNEVGDYFQLIRDTTRTALDATQQLAKVAAHGLVGGISSKLNGGRFIQGFISAGFTQAVGGRITTALPVSERMPARVFAAAMAGGVSSVMGGGKFADGAVTGAFSRLFNDGLHGRNARARALASARAARYQRGTGLYVTGHRVGGIGPTHLAIEHVPADGSGASWVSAGPDNGLLVSGVDGARPTDIPSNNYTVGIITPPAGVGVSAYYQTMLGADAVYCDCIDYDTFPGIANSYNTNSFISGLIGATGGSASIDLGNYVGGSDPLPAAYFGY